MKFAFLCCHIIPHSGGGHFSAARILQVSNHPSERILRLMSAFSGMSAGELVQILLVLGLKIKALLLAARLELGNAVALRLRLLLCDLDSLQLFGRNVLNPLCRTFRFLAVFELSCNLGHNLVDVKEEHEQYNKQKTCQCNGALITEVDPCDCHAQRRFPVRRFFPAFCI